MRANTQINLDDYPTKIYVVPKGPTCAWGGMGYVGCQGDCRVWIQGDLWMVGRRVWPRGWFWSRLWRRRAWAPGEKEGLRRDERGPAAFAACSPQQSRASGRPPRAPRPPENHHPPARPPPPRQKPVVYFHEISHNLYCNHAGKWGSRGYEDMSGAMGYCCDLRCHNAPHSHQLGWAGPVKTLHGGNFPAGTWNTYRLPAAVANPKNFIRIWPDWSRGGAKSKWYIQYRWAGTLSFLAKLTP